MVLGVLPFARELLKRGTRVVLAANEAPSINDITAAELQPLLVEAAQVDGIIQSALAQGDLKVVSSGNAIPVIDLSGVSREIAAEASSGNFIGARYCQKHVLDSINTFQKSLIMR